MVTRSRRRGSSNPASSAVSALLLLPLTWLQDSRAQYPQGSAMYNREVEKQEALLTEQLKSGPELELHYYPERAFPSPDYYIMQEPDAENYKIGVIVEPCKGKEPDCCMNLYGTPEYGLLKTPDLTYPYRVVPKYDLGSDMEILANVELVDETRTTLSSSAIRRADDQSIVAEECEGASVPYTYCTGFRKKMSPFPIRPACMDNNQTVDATAGCFDPITKKWSPHCMQVAYMQTAFSVVCGNEFRNDPHCGTFLEIHLPNGSPDYDKSVKLSEYRITERNTTGYTTVTMSLEYQFNDSFVADSQRRIACGYFEEKIRVGTSVLIRDTAPKCCCPDSFTWCPVIQYDSGPTCVAANSISQKMQVDSAWNLSPYCYPMPAAEDWVMCQAYSANYSRNIHYRCPFVNDTQSVGIYGSSAINNTHYTAKCPYFPECVLAYTSNNDTKVCGANEDMYTFHGRVGTVTYAPPDIDKGMYRVTFNDGRSEYEFAHTDLIIDNPSYNYEIWWVQRTRYDFIIQKKKPFKVTKPTCTYDAQREQYLPYAIKLTDGTFLDTMYV